MSYIFLGYSRFSGDLPSFLVMSSGHPDIYVLFQDSEVLKKEMSWEKEIRSLCVQEKEAVEA